MILLNSFCIIQGSSLTLGRTLVTINIMTRTSILLAAGYGSRISTLTRNPKCLLTIDKTTLLERHMSLFKACGIENVVLVVGYEKEQILTHVKPFQDQLNITICDNSEYEKKGNLYSLYMGLQQAQTDAIIFDGDLMYTVDILSRYLHDEARDSLIVGHGSKDDIESTKVLMDSQKQVRLLVDKRSITDEEIHQYSFLGEAMGMIKISNDSRPMFLNMIDQFFRGDANNIGANWEPLINLYIQTYPLAAIFEPSKQWIEIDTPEDYEAAQSLFEPVMLG